MINFYACTHQYPILCDNLVIFVVYRIARLHWSMSLRQLRYFLGVIWNEILSMSMSMNLNMSMSMNLNMNLSMNIHFILSSLRYDATHMRTNILPRSNFQSVSALEHS